MKTKLVLMVVLLFGVGFLVPSYGQLPTWADYNSITYEQQGESLYVAIQFKGPVLAKGDSIHAGNTIFNDYDDNIATGQPGNVGSECNLTFCDWDGDNTWCMRVYGFWNQSVGTFGFSGLAPVNLSPDGLTLSFKHSIVGLGLEDISYDVNGYWLAGTSWWSDPYNVGASIPSLGLYSFNPSLVPAIDTSLTGSRSKLRILASYKAKALSENITGALDEIVNTVESELGPISPTKPYTVTYNPYTNYSAFPYIGAPNNMFTTYIPGSGWDTTGTPDWWAMIEGAVDMTMRERSAGFREIFATSMNTDLPLPNTADSWYSTRLDSTHGFMWKVDHVPTYKAIIGRAFHNLITIYIGEKLASTGTHAAAVAARTQAANAYAAFSGNASALDPWIMTGFLLNKLGSNVDWTKTMWQLLPATFTVPVDTILGDAFGQFAQGVLRSGFEDGTKPYASRKLWYQNIGSTQAGAIDAVTGGNIYAQLKSITGYPTSDSVYNAAKTLIQGLVAVNDGAPAVPRSFKVFQNYPNPFNPTTKIVFVLPNRALTTVKVYDVLGREVNTLLQENLEAGRHEITWNARQLSSGVYFYRVESGKYMAVTKAVLLK